MYIAKAEDRGDPRLPYDPLNIIVNYICTSGACREKPIIVKETIYIYVNKRYQKTPRPKVVNVTCRNKAEKVTCSTPTSHRFAL